MARFLSSFWAQKPEPEDGEGGGDGKGGSTADGATGAASWISMRDPSAGDRGEPVMTVNQATVKGVLEPLGDKEAVNLVAIFGAARGGKSFLMNQLAGQDDIFKISNDKARRGGQWSNPLNHFACCVFCGFMRCAHRFTRTGVSDSPSSEGWTGGGNLSAVLLCPVHRAQAASYPYLDERTSSVVSIVFYYFSRDTVSSQ